MTECPNVSVVPGLTLKNNNRPTLYKCGRRYGTLHRGSSRSGGAFQEEVGRMGECQINPVSIVAIVIMKKA